METGIGANIAATIAGVSAETAIGIAVGAMAEAKDIIGTVAVTVIEG